MKEKIEKEAHKKGKGKVRKTRLKKVVQFGLSHYLLGHSWVSRTENDYNKSLCYIYC